MLQRAQNWSVNCYLDEAVVYMREQCNGQVSSASKSSIRRFVITEKAPSRVIRDGWVGYLVSIVSYSRPSLMIIESRTQFHVERPWGQRPFSIVS